MKTTFTKVPTGWRWEIDDDDAMFSGVRPTKVEAHAEALACWSGVLYAEVNGDSPAPEPQLDWRARAEAAEQRAEALSAEVARLRAGWTAAVAEVAAMGAEPDRTGLALTPRRSPATLAALREVARMLAEAQPAEVSNV